MRINIPSRAPVQSLGRRAPAQRDIAGEQALQSIQRDIENVNAIKKKRQRQQSWLFTQKVSDEYKAAWGGKDAFHVDELPSEVVTEGMKMKGRVLSAEVYPEMYKRTMESAIKDASLIIDNPQARAEWLTEAKGVALSSYSKIQTQANKDIEAQIFKDQMQSYNNAIISNDPSSALAIVSNMRESGTASKEELDELELKAKKKGETNTYDEFMVAEDVAMMKNFVEFLKNEKNYRKNGGSLNDGERLVWKHKLQAELSRITRGSDAAIKADKKLIEREIKITIQNLLKSKNSEPDKLLALIDRGIKADVSPATLKNLEGAAHFASGNDFQTKLSRFDRLEFAANFVKNSGLEGFEKDQLMRRFETSHFNQVSAGDADTMQMASDAGFVTLSPVDADNPREFALQMVVRKRQMDNVQENYQKFNDNMLTKTEAASISDRVNLRPADEKIKYLQATTAAMGEDAVMLYDQLNIDGSIGALAIAGITSVKGSIEQSRAILMGGEYLQRNKEEITDVNRILNMEIRKDVGDAFYRASGTQSAVKDALTNAYVHYVITSGGSLQTGFNADAYEKAKQAATGGMVTYGVNTLQAPAYGMGQRGFDDWIDNVDPAWIDELGGVPGMSSKNFVSTLQDRNFKLVGESYGVYIVSRNNNEPLENATYGGAFRLIYNPDKVLPRKKSGNVFIERRMRERERIKKQIQTGLEMGGR